MYEFRSYDDLTALKAHKCGNGLYVVIEGDTGHVYSNSPSHGAKLEAGYVMLALIKSDVMDAQSKAAISAAPTL